MEMISLSTDPIQEPVSSPMSTTSLSSSPVKSQTIKDLLESPIINRSQSHYSDEEILVCESPEHQPFDGELTEDNHSQAEDSFREVPNTQDMKSQSSIDRSNGRNQLKRQTSICVTSSPRALAILKNAIKTSNNSNCDKNNENNCSQELNADLNGFSIRSNSFNINNNINTNIYSPPNSKIFGKSPFSRGSALLKAAKDRINKEYGTPPKPDCDSAKNSLKRTFDESSNDSFVRDRQLTGILRRHELMASPTSAEPKSKKKKVLFAEPVVSSEREFDCGQLLSVTPLRSINSLENELNERKRNNLVHQDSTFHDNDSNPCDTNDNDSSDSPLLISDYFTETPDPICYENPNSFINNEDENHSVDTSTDAGVVPDNYELNDSGIPLITEDLSEISSSDDTYPSSQPLQFNTINDEESKDCNSNEDCDVESDPSDPEDTIVKVPMRLSLIRELYNIFGNIIDRYSDT